MAQNLKPNRKDNRGGHENVGRKKIGNIRYNRTVTEFEKRALNALINQIRGNPEQTDFTVTVLRE